MADGPGSLYLRLAEALRVFAETGAVTTGTRLPCERALAAALNVSRNTITAAYRQLRDTGWLIGHQGAAPRVGATTRVLGNDTVPADPLAELFTDEQRPRLDLTIASPFPAPSVVDALTRSPVLMPDSATQDGGYYPAGHPVHETLVRGRARGSAIAWSAGWNVRASSRPGPRCRRTVRGSLSAPRSPGARTAARRLEILRDFQRADRASVHVDGDGIPAAYLLTEIIDCYAHIEQVSVHPDHARKGDRASTHRPPRSVGTGTQDRGDDPDDLHRRALERPLPPNHAVNVPGQHRAHPRPQQDPRR
jgi:hypothetical protein